MIAEGGTHVGKEGSIFHFIGGQTGFFAPSGRDIRKNGMTLFPVPPGLAFQPDPFDPAVVALQTDFAVFLVATGKGPVQAFTEHIGVLGVSKSQVPALCRSVSR